MDDEILDNLHDFCLIGEDGSYSIFNYVSREIFIFEDNEEAAQIISLLKKKEVRIFRDLKELDFMKP